MRVLLVSLLNDHFHLLIKPGGDSISRIMQSLLVSHTHRYHKHRGSGGHVWQGRFKSPAVQKGDHLLTVLQYLEANPLRAKIVKRAENYPWSSYRSHGLGEANELVDPLPKYEELSPYAKVRQRKWSEQVHLPLAAQTLSAIRKSSTTGLPYGDSKWIASLAKRLNLDLTIRPRKSPATESKKK